jgi:hypothetical protein
MPASGNFWRSLSLRVFNVKKGRSQLRAGRGIAPIAVVIIAVNQTLRVAAVDVAIGRIPDVPE